MAKYIELIDKYRIEQGSGDYNPPSYIWEDNTGEVVRCKECKYWEEDWYICTYDAPITYVREEYDYCSRGDRKND